MEDIELCCIICEEDYSDDIIPRNLGCGHSLCTVCTDKIILSDTDKTCPECRQPISAKSASNLNVNYPLLRLARSFAASKSMIEDPLEENLSDSIAIPTIKTKTSENKIFIDDYGYGPIWRENPLAFTCTVSCPKKQSKYYGMMNYIAYTIIPSFSSKRVLRRYKQFDWLQNQMSDRYPCILIPPLPESKIINRFNEELIEYRQRMLQTWMDRVCRHPVISQSDVFQLFITVSNKKSWKRKATDDRLANDSFYSSINLQDSCVDMTQMKHKLEEHGLCTSKLDRSLKLLLTASVSQANNYKTTYKEDNMKVSHAFMKLSQAFRTDLSCGPELPAVIQHVSEAYSDIGNLFAEEPEQTWEPLQNLLVEYQGLVEGFDKISSVAKKSLANWIPEDKEMAKLQLEMSNISLESDEVAKSTSSRDAVKAASAFQAEAAHFHQERIRDFKKSLKTFLVQQVSFHQRITDRLKESLDEVLREYTEKEVPTAPQLEVFDEQELTAPQLEVFDKEEPMVPKLVVFDEQEPTVPHLVVFNGI